MRVLTWLIFLTACGQPDGGGSGDGPNLVAQGQQEEQPSAEQGGGKQYAELVNTEADLPACDATTEGRIAHVKADASFRACSSGVWAVIDLKGAAGVAGEKGDKGEKGERGEEGSTTAWLDPSTNLRWMKASNGNFATALLACSGDFRLPTSVELLAAALHGLATGLPGAADAWAGPDNANSFSDYVLSLASNPSAASRAKTDVIGIYCISSP